MKQIVCALFLLALTACAPKHIDLTPKAVHSLDEIIEKEKSGQRKASLMFVMSGKKKLESKRFEQAALDLGQAIEIDALNPFAYYYLAQVRESLEKPKDAISLYDRSSKLADLYPEWKVKALYRKAEILEKEEQPLRAKQTYLDILELDPKEHEALRAKKRLEGETDE